MECANVAGAEGCDQWEEDRGKGLGVWALEDGGVGKEADDEV